MAKRKKLTEEEWAKVFAARCQTKRGLRISDEEQVLVNAAFDENKVRYAALEKDVFNATVPFGSTKRWV